MQDYQELTPDAETFRRVWKRVMPDESLSQIVVHPPTGGKEDRPPQSRTPQPAAPAPVSDEVRLRRLLESLDEGSAGAGEIQRRQSGAWPMRDSMRSSVDQARAAWLLLTGQRWNPKKQNMGSRESLERLLRRQYVWEIGFSQLCREQGKDIQAEDIREICPHLEEESRRRRRMIRSFLART